MKIRFKKGDPREGMVAEFDSSRGQELIDAGSAVEVKDNEPEPKAEAMPEPEKVKKTAKKDA